MAVGGQKGTHVPGAQGPGVGVVKVNGPWKSTGGILSRRPGTPLRPESRQADLGLKRQPGKPECVPSMATRALVGPPFSPAEEMGSEGDSASSRGHINDQSKARTQSTLLWESEEKGDFWLERDSRCLESPKCSGILII